MVLIASMLAAAAPAPATAFLTAVETGDLATARAALADNVVIMDERSGRPTASSLAAFAEYLHGCRRTDLSSEVDPDDATRAAATIGWACRGRPDAGAYVWTERARVVQIEFGSPPGR